MMINQSKKCFNLYVFRRAFVFSALILLVAISDIKVTADDIEWDVTINFNETSGKNDYITFGEASDASDGLDGHDIPNPPGGISPALDAYISTDFTYPHNRLVREIKKYPDTDKEWNFSVQWIDGVTTVTITMLWDTDKINSSEYESFFLYNGSGAFLTDMSVNNKYEFLCSSYSPVDFKIICSFTSHTPNTPSNPYPGDGATGVTIDADLSWLGGDPDPEDTVTYDIYFGTSSNPPMVITNHNSTTYDPGEINNATCYYWKIMAHDNHGHTTEGPVWNFTTINKPPYVPGNPSPTGNSVPINTVLSWTGGDPDDGDIVTYDVYFGTNNPPPLVVSKQSGISFNPETLGYETTYYWQIVAGDNNGAKTNGLLWSFTTVSSSNGNSGNDTNGEENKPPTADASTSETFGFVGALITFNGSLSIDLDGYITNWLWDFGDNNTGSGEITTHAYTNVGTYAVTLTVYDDDDAVDIDTIIIMISKENNAPTKPIINGTKAGNKNTDYVYTIQSTDADNDSIQYIINWGDGKTTTTKFLPNGAATTQSHAWTSAGKYTIYIKAFDNKTESSIEDYIVLIDAHLVDGIGYLTDNNIDEIYDLFHNDATGNETDIEQQDDGTYLIDEDGDSFWDYIYDLETDTLVEYIHEGGKISEVSWMIVALTAMLLTSITIIIYLYKKNCL